MPLRGAYSENELVQRIAHAEIEIERLRARVSELVKLLDDQYGTPCEQIRHQQEVERLTAAPRRALWHLKRYNQPEAVAILTKALAGIP